MRLKIILAAAMLAFVVSGCVTGAPETKSPAEQKAGVSPPTYTVTAPALIASKKELERFPNLALFDIPAGGFEYTSEEISGASKHVVRRITYPSPFESPVACNNTVYAEYYEPVGKGPFPAVIVLHHITNEFNATRSMCRELANNGIAALMPMMPYYGERRPADADDRVPYRIDVPTMRQAVMDIRRAHQLLESFPAIDRSRIGLVGLSLGAIIGPLAAGVDGKFNRCVFIMGGGHIADIIWCSPLTEDTRKELETGGVTLESLRAAFKPVESTEYATRIETSSVMMLNMKSDKWVPTEATEALWLALGKPENIHWYSGSHLSIIFRWPDVMDRTIAFIRQ